MLVIYVSLGIIIGILSYILYYIRKPFYVNIHTPSNEVKIVKVHRNV